MSPMEMLGPKTKAQWLASAHPGAPGESVLEVQASFLYSRMIQACRLTDDCVTSPRLPSGRLTPRPPISDSEAGKLDTPARLTPIAPSSIPKKDSRPSWVKGTSRDRMPKFNERTLLGAFTRYSPVGIVAVA